MTSLNSLMANNGVAFGTSGARGLVEGFTTELCFCLTSAFLDTISSSLSKQDKVFLACDLRPSSEDIMLSCASSIRYLGFEPIFLGVIPTPALAYYSMLTGGPGIVVTGSHIPFDRNGLKFYTYHGEITKDQQEAILEAKASYFPTLQLDEVKTSSIASRYYVSRYLSWFDDSPLLGWRVGVYQHSAAGRDIVVEILASLGAEVIELGRTSHFVPIDTEAVSDADHSQANAWARDNKLDALLTTDGDGDRPLLADESGNWLRGDILGLLCARELGIDALAVPVSCNSVIEACGEFEEVARTKIGSPYVIEAMENLSAQHRSVAGFEANGGFLLGASLTRDGKQLSALPTRDAMLPALTIMVAAAKQGKPLSALLKGLPERYTASDRLREFPTAESNRLLSKWTDKPDDFLRDLGFDEGVRTIDLTDGLRVTLSNGDIIHLRPSGNAPELRCYAESRSQEAAEKLVSHTLNRIVWLS